ncbi:MAG: ATP-binding protein [Okeania sp. SIO3B3]|nr:ATP-binding protein [Okeania sp. SIO3B3]
MTDKYQVKNVDRLIYTTAISVIEDCTNKIFYNILNSDLLEFQSNSSILNATEYQQLKIAIEQLESNYKTQQISPLHIANIDFILGREEYGNSQIEQALKKLKNSLLIWKNSTKVLPGEVVTQQINERLEKIGVVLFHIGLCYEHQGNLNILQKNNYWQQAQNNFQQSLDLFAQIDRQELVAKFIIQQGEVLKKLEAWTDLYKLAQHALELHLTYGTEEQIAQDYGFLAEAAMHESKWDHASQLAELAVAIQHQSVDDPLEIAQYQNSYFSILTESQSNLEEWQATVNQLEKARRQTNHHHDLQSYLSILKALKKLYFEQDQYGKSARIKEEKLRIEHQYGLKAFIGINPLQAQQNSDNNPIIPREIKVSSRLKDVNNLVARIKSQDHKLIVIHGDSGVGKSSLINSGLIPALLAENSEDHQVILPILLRVHTDWMRNSNSATWNLEYVLETLRTNNQKNNVKVLILDQFEEFFTVCPKPAQRLPLYQFLYDCLRFNCVKVVLSIQTNYLHYLLECDRLTNLEAVINYEILSKEILYYISNFEPSQSQEIIKNLIEPAQLNWEPDLISQVVKDLSAADNTVSPIELQVVGTQLQEEAITTVEAYRKLGDNPVQQLTINFIDGVIKDCGFLNGRTAISVLYLLTNEHGTRPLKTRVELASDLLMETNKLDVVLEVLVAQGLVLLLPDLAEDRYQLAHNYLIPLVREQKQEGEISISEFEFERDMMQ